MLRAPDAGAKLKLLEVQKLEEEAKRVSIETRRRYLSGLLIRDPDRAKFVVQLALHFAAKFRVVGVAVNFEWFLARQLFEAAELVDQQNHVDEVPRLGVVRGRLPSCQKLSRGFNPRRESKYHLFLAIPVLSRYLQVDSISQILAARCPSFFSEADRTRYQGFELMTKAKYSERFDEKESYLRASLEVRKMTEVSEACRIWSAFVQLFKKIPDHLNRQDVLQAITEEYQYLRYYEGAVILALECANAADPSGAGFTWFQEGMSDKDERGKTAYQKRIKTYSNIIRVLDELHTGAFTGLVTDRSVPRPTLDATELENEKLKVIKVI